MLKSIGLLNLNAPKAGLEKPVGKQIYLYRMALNGEPQRAILLMRNPVLYYSGDGMLDVSAFGVKVILH
jgi:hypothetical protein